MAGQEYFSVHHSMVVNVEPLTDDYVLPTINEFEAEIPHSFIIASEFSQLDQLNDKAMLELKHSDLRYVMQLLDHQNSKLNLILTYMLSEQDDKQHRFHTLSFGASQFSYQSNSALPIDSHSRAKLFWNIPQLRYTATPKWLNVSNMKMVTLLLWNTYYCANKTKTC